MRSARRSTARRRAARAARHGTARPMLPWASWRCPRLLSSRPLGRLPRESEPSGNRLGRSAASLSIPHPRTAFRTAGPPAQAHQLTLRTRVRPGATPRWWAGRRPAGRGARHTLRELSSRSGRFGWSQRWRGEGDTGLDDGGGITYAFQASSGAGWGPSRRNCECAMMAELPSSSSGLGRRPFKAVARVRIPLGVRTGLGQSKCKNEQ